MLAIFILPANMNLFAKITSNDNINVGNLHHTISEWYNKTSNTQCRLYLPYIHQAPKLEIITKYDQINVSVVPWKIYF